MSIQSVLIYVIFGVAVFYMARRLYKSLKHKDGGACEHCAPSSLSEPKKAASHK